MRDYVVASSKSEDICAEPRSHPGRFLKDLLARRPGAKRKREAAE